MADLESPIVVAEWERSAREVVRITLQDYRGTALVSLRVWFRDQGTLKPGRDGLNLSVKHLSNLADGLAMAVSRAKALGLIDG